MMALAGTIGAAAASRGFKFGASFELPQYNGDAGYAAFLRSNFDLYTPAVELKDGRTWTGDGTHTFTTSDAFVAVAAADGKSVRGHALFVPSNPPSWLAAVLDSSNCRRLATQHIQAMLAQYPQIDEWDAIIELFDGTSAALPNGYKSNIWTQAFGSGDAFLQYVFSECARLAPIKRFFYSDNSTEQGDDDWRNAHRANILGGLTRALAAGVRIFGVSLQFHLTAGTYDTTSKVPFLNFLIALAALGLHVNPTEIDVRYPTAGWTGTDAAFDALAAGTLDTVAVTFIQSGVPFDHMTGWTPTDKYTWLANAPNPSAQRPSLFDANFAAKPMEVALQARISALSPNQYQGASHMVNTTLNAELAARTLSPPALAAQRILRAAAKGITPITTVMASPPTITQAATDGANSTVITTVAPSAATPANVTLLGGPLLNGRLQTVTNGASRVNGHSAGVAFQTNASVFDVSVRANGNRLIVYVTDVLTGVRARVAAADLVATFSNYNFYKFDFGSRALRTIEVYIANVGNIGAINVPATDSIWPVELGQPRICGIWDSYGEGSMNDGTLNLKLAVYDFWAAALGVNNPYVNALGSTGVIANAGSKTNFQGRLDAGDFDASRLATATWNGNFDLIDVGGSINDYNTSNGGVASDATFQAAYTTFIAALMAKQPNAIIVGSGPEVPNAGPPTQARFDATKAGFLAAAGGDPRMIYLDNSPTGENWMFGNSATGINSVILTGSGADNIHPFGVAGTSYIGERKANSTLAAIRAAFPL